MLDEFSVPEIMWKMMKPSRAILVLKNILIYHLNIEAYFRTFVCRATIFNSETLHIQRVVIASYSESIALDSLLKFLREKFYRYTFRFLCHLRYE